MKCNLVKKVSVKEVDGNKKYFTHFYLVFENGVRVRICAEYIPSKNIKDQAKADKIDASNRANALSLNNMADVEK